MKDERLKEFEAENKILREALEKYIRAGCLDGTHYENQKAALENAMKVLDA
ncbi:MAG: hypothetical protein QQN41_08525 [Nitrosopumilus sp.]